MYMSSWTVLLALAIPVVAVDHPGSTKSHGSKPHILFFMADDTGWYNVGWHNPDIKTPNANKLIEEGIELDRHYAFIYCSPSRTSMMTGRLPYHAQQINYRNSDIGQGAPDNMTFISTKLKSAGYATAQFGKWHLGCYSLRQTPLGRGFDTSLVYFEGAEDHFTQRTCQDPECIVPINASSNSPYDLWANDGPAKSLAGTRYNGYMFNDEAVSFINEHNSAVPMFMYLAADNAHVPLEVPQEWMDLYPSDWYLDRLQFAGMCSFWDSILGNVTAALKNKGMWNNTLLVFSSDNGGPTYWSTTPSFPHGAGANNWPLKGSKVSAWEGGIRVAAFASGGIIPANVRGTKLKTMIHMADWYATFCNLAGVDPTDKTAAAAGLPPIDSVDIWPLLTGMSQEPPREHMPIVVDFPQGKRRIGGNVSAVIGMGGTWKLLEGMQVLSYWQGPDFPNASYYGQFTDPRLDHLCRPCLYNLDTDPTETTDVASDHPDIVKTLALELVVARGSRYQRPEQPDEDAALAAVKRYGNFWGPWLP